MTTVMLTLDDTLRFSDLKKMLLLIRGISNIEILKQSNKTDKQEYEQLKNAFISGSKQSMSQHISKYL